MNERQYEIYKFIVSYAEKNLYAPTFKEIQQAVGLKSRSSVSYNLLVIEQLGYIKVKMNAARAITLQGYKIVKVA